MDTIIVEKIKALSPEFQQEVIHFIDFLRTKKSSKQVKKPNLEWIGGLKEYHDQFTALELEKKASDWRD